MSWLSSVLIHQLEKELIAMEPEIAHFMIEQIQKVGSHVLDWVDKKGYHAASIDPKSKDEGEL